MLVLMDRSTGRTDAVPRHFHDTDIKMEGMLVHHLGALRRAIHSPDTYYREYSANPSLPLRNPTHTQPLLHLGMVR